MKQDVRFPVVGIGASAGGVEALKQFFAALSLSPGAAFVVVTHLGPGRESQLPAIIAHVTKVPVSAAAHGAQVERDHIYVLATDAVITLAGGRFVLHPPEARGQRERQPIDAFFASLAEDQDACAVGVVLSGSGSDGTLGLRAIKEHGGLTFAQGTDHTFPRHASMPDSAIASGAVDLVLPVQDMPARIVEFARGYGAVSILTTEEKPPTEAERIATARIAICDLLRDQIGHDFSGYKQNTFLRRVARRMHVVQIADLDAYVDRLRTNAEEVSALFRDLLIGVTEFFRDPDAFAALAEQVIPALFEGRGADDFVRVWVPGCTTGEEAYSIAMLLRERMDTLRNVPKVQVFATDIDEQALTVARAGRYPHALIADIPKERLARFFVEDGAFFAVAKPVRDMCMFSSHSVIRDTPFSRIDLVSCRNLLIYLDRELQDRVMPIFHYALLPDRFLFLGSAENVTKHEALFAPKDRGHRIFQRRDAAAMLPDTMAQSWRGVSHARTGLALQPRSIPPAGGMRKAVHEALLEAFTPAHLVVNRDGDIVDQSAGLARFLDPPPGAPTRQLLALARRGLRLDLAAVLREAIQTARPATRPRTEFEIDGQVVAVRLTVTPLPVGPGILPLYLVVLAELANREAEARPEDGAAAPADAAAHAELMEREHRDTRERLQGTIEEYETAVEELRSANEEMVSVNEELQSANEELETAKEEQQSVNEELEAVNQELSGKIDQLDRANADLRNLFESTRIATLFLDRHLVIRSYTPAAAIIFNLIPTDVGRPLSDMAGHLDHGDLREDVRLTLDAREMIERRVTSHGGEHHYLMRLLPYRTVTGEVDGVLLTFVDVSHLVREQTLEMMIGKLNHRVLNVLSVVSALASQTLEAAESPEEFVVAFRSRLASLGRAHELVARTGWTTVGLRDLLLRELIPYVGQTERAQLDGPAVALSPQVALALGMVIHELTTNAVKYGSLSVPEGRVAVGWQLDDGQDDNVVVITWHETGGPAVGERGRRGFGSSLIENQLRHALDGEVVLDFREKGLHAVLTVPLKASRREAAIKADALTSFGP